MKKSIFVIFVLVMMMCGCSQKNEQSAQETPKANAAWYDLLQKYRMDPQVKHLVLVQCLDKSNAKVLFFGKDSICGVWTKISDTDGYIGRCGWTDDKHEGDGKTPTGDFGILTAFGIKPDPGTSLPYIDITDDLYAVDSESEYYNKIVSAKEVGPVEGEHMWDYSPDYNYGLFMDYNPKCEYDKGSAIFFHCKGAKPYTGGCVAVDEDIMKMILQRLSPSDRICIYPL